MRTEEIVQALKKRRILMTENIFDRPPPDEKSFAKQQGIWLGLGEALNIISEEVRKEGSDD